MEHAQILVHAGASTSFDADNRYRRQAQASLGFRRVRSYRLEAQDELVIRAQSVADPDSWQTDLVLESQQPFVSCCPPGISVAKGGIPVVRKSLPEVIGLSRLQFTHHETLSSQRSQIEAQEEQAMIQAADLMTPYAATERTADHDTGTGPELPLPVRATLVREVELNTTDAQIMTPLEAVKLRAQRGFEKRQALFSGITSIATNGRDAALGKPLEANTLDVNRYVTIASSEQGQSRTPPSDGHTTTQSPLECVQHDLSPNLSFKIPRKRKRSFLDDQENSPHYVSTFIIPAKKMETRPPLLTHRIQQYSEESINSILGTQRAINTSNMLDTKIILDYTQCVEKCYRSGAELLLLTPAVNIPELILIPECIRKLKYRGQPKLLRELRPIERGYWRLDLNHFGFTIIEASAFWRDLRQLLYKNDLYWVSGQYVQGCIRVYCYGDCAIPVWIMLYSISRKKLKKRCSWHDAEGNKVLIFPYSTSTLNPSPIS